MTPEVRLKQIQSHITRMPSLSTTVAKVLEVCNNPIASPNELNKVIALDPVLTGQVLRLINSAYYSLPNRISSLTRAIIMLGINTVKNLVLATSVLSAFKGSRFTGTFSIDDYWVHSLCVGAISKELARINKVPAMQQEEYFVAGLLHDLGKLPMIACFDDLYIEAIKTGLDESIPLFLAERRHIGFDHCQVGWLIGAKWKLSGEMKDAIVNHHQLPAQASLSGNLVDFVSLANQLAQQFRIGDAGDYHEDKLMIHALAERMGTTPDVLTALKPKLEQEVEKAKIFLKQSRKG